MRYIKMPNIAPPPVGAGKASKSTQTGLTPKQQKSGVLDSSIGVWVVETTPTTYKCRNCDTPFIPKEIECRRCLACHTYLYLPGEELADVVAARGKYNMFSWDIDVTKNPPKTIMAWALDGTEFPVYIPNGV